MSESALTDALAAALKALEGVQLTAGKADARVMDAERRAAEAEEQAAKDRKAKQEAEGKVHGLEQQVIDAAGANAAEMAALQASNELLSERDREARDEIERLRLATKGVPKRVGIR